MDKSLIENLVESNRPFRVETASGRVFEIPHRDFMSFSRNKTALYVSYEEDGESILRSFPC